MKGFPNYYKFLGIKLFPKGWEDRGMVASSRIRDAIYKFDACPICKTRAHIGFQDKERFLFCPKGLCRLRLDK